MKPALVALLVTLPSLAQAGPWTRDRGHFYLSSSYSRIAASSFYGPDFKTVPILPYEQHLVSLYGEVGLVTRWLTASVDGSPITGIDGYCM